MKIRILPIYLIILIVFFSLSGCKKDPETVPDAILQLKIDECIDTWQFDDCDSLETDIKHNPDKSNHLDTVEVLFTAHYPYGTYKSSLQNCVYQYDRASENWSIISDGTIGDTEVAWEHLDDLLGYYEADGSYRCAWDFTDYKYEWINEDWWCTLEEIDADGLSLYASGSYWGVDTSSFWIQFNYHPFNGIIYADEMRQQSSKYHHVLCAPIDKYGPSIYITPENGFAFTDDTRKDLDDLIRLQDNDFIRKSSDITESSHTDYYDSESGDSIGTIESESNNTYESANVISLDSMYSGSLAESYYTEEDWFRFSLKKSGTVRVVVYTEKQADNSIYWDARIRSAANPDVDLWQKFIKGETTETSSGGLSLPAGDYYFEIESSDKHTADVYSFCVFLDSVGMNSGTVESLVESENNNTYKSANDISLDSIYYGSLAESYYTEEDWFRFSLKESGTVKVVVYTEKQADNSIYWDVRIRSAANPNVDLWQKFIKGGTTETSSGNLSLPAGDYYFEIESSDKHTPDTYSFCVLMNPNGTDNNEHYGRWEGKYINLGFDFDLFHKKVNSIVNADSDLTITYSYIDGDDFSEHALASALPFDELDTVREFLTQISIKYPGQKSSIDVTISFRHHFVGLVDDELLNSTVVLGSKTYRCASGRNGINDIYDICVGNDDFECWAYVNVESQLYSDLLYQACYDSFYTPN